MKNSTVRRTISTLPAALAPTLIALSLTIARTGNATTPPPPAAPAGATTTAPSAAPAVPTTPASTPPLGAQMQQRLKSYLDPGTGAWTTDQIATMGRLRDAALADDYAYRELDHLTNNIGPRLSGSPQAAQAVEYVAAQMRALGATVTLEKTLVPHWIRGAENGALVAWPGMTPQTTQKIVLTALGGSVATPAGGITAPLLVVPSSDALAHLPDGAAKGKILVLNHSFDQELAARGQSLQAYGQAVVYRGAAPTLAASVGAIAVLVRSVGGADYRLPHTGATYYVPGTPRVPAAAVTAEDADLMADLAAQGPVEMHLTLTPATFPKVASYNVIADWPGSTHPEQIVIVSGHLDSWDLGTGAIDDGAGVVVSMQTIQLMNKLNIHPQRTLRFIAWMDEESGSDGATTYASDHASDIANHVGALESDLGCDHPVGIAFTGTPALAEWLRPVAQQLEPIGATVVESSPEVGADVESVVSQGVPGFAPIQDNRFYFNYHHTAADTLDKVNPRYLKENAAVMAVAAYALADSAAPAPRAR